MDWFRAIDAYCERTSPSFWAEPLNAATNLAFFVSAYFALRAVYGLRAEAATGGKETLSLQILGWLIAIIGSASLAFHTFGQVWAAFLDSGFIAIYLHLYCAVFARWVLGVRWRWAWLGAPAFLVFSLVLGMGLRAGLKGTLGGLSGLGAYLPALVVLLGMALAMGWRRHASAPWLAVTAVTFAVSLCLRQLDMPLCSEWRHGTHFLWHLLNACVLWLSMRALIVARRSLAHASLAG